MTTFWLCFVPLFVAVDVIGTLPLFVGLTEGLPDERVRKVVVQSVITAMIAALLFVLVGPAFLSSVGITVADFMIAGGILLLVFSIGDMHSTAKPQQVDVDSLGIVPVGVPLITGPAVLTTSILLLNQYGLIATAAAVITNIVLAGFVLAGSRHVYRVLGKTGTKALSKLANIVLAAIGVMMIRRGVFACFPQ
ncbi:MAG: hypothetical protein A3K19_10530 [Lentisphaerae bacterium RIFOXYB12_FULL_65_16]|nr:MAG: hypothetical protein A3K18_33005 [Lentisphaerae bacterium RIFOXYA12_64_32]OGV87945.1 MAG: hypothetical protein A3K19_10530 [Lentisphaerae bacterium RIFOXYB12_FULL_65_16]